MAKDQIQRHARIPVERRSPAAPRHAMPATAVPQDWDAATLRPGQSRHDAPR
ncbi:hypothetical protein PATSB16_04040 [Pandoraea thiooxydans]|nr:hypothetical protein PATSB16_04040 [Pandoraea thiooxydans]